MLDELLAFPETVLLSEDMVLTAVDELGRGFAVLAELDASAWLAGGAGVVVCVDGGGPGPWGLLGGGGF